MKVLTSNIAILPLVPASLGPSVKVLEGNRTLLKCITKKLMKGLFIEVQAQLRLLSIPEISSIEKILLLLVQMENRKIQHCQSPVKNRDREESPPGKKCSIKRGKLLYQGPEAWSKQEEKHPFFFLNSCPPFSCLCLPLARISQKPEGKGDKLCSPQDLCRNRHKTVTTIRIMTGCIHRQPG